MRGQGRRVVTPDGHVWFVRRRRARRRPFWSGRRPERFHGEDELPAERLPEPGLLDLFTTRGYDVQHPTFDWRIENDETRLFHAVMIGAAAVAVMALLVWLAATYVLPWLVPLVTANARPLLTAAIREGRIDNQRAVILRTDVRG